MVSIKTLRISFYNTTAVTFVDCVVETSQIATSECLQVDKMTENSSSSDVEILSGELIFSYH